MKLTLMAPLRVHFCLDSRALSHIYPNTAGDYFAFWDALIANVASDPATSALGGDVTYFHRTNQSKYGRPEYSSIARDTDVVQAATLAVAPRLGKAGLNESWRKAMKAELDERPEHYGAVPADTSHDWARRFDVDPESLKLTVFDNTIAVVEIALDIAVDKAGLASCLSQFLDAIQGTANRFVPTLVESYYEEALRPFLAALYKNQPRGNAYLLDPDALKSFRDLRDLTVEDAAHPAAANRVRWVTRTLGIDKDKRDAPDRDFYEEIVRRWLADIGKYTDAADIVENRRSFSFRWVNYLHWPRTDTKADAADGATSAALADSWEGHLHYDEAWNALVLAQYFYASLDALNVNLSLILGAAYARDAGKAIREINEAVSAIMSRTKLAILNFRDREKYLMRAKRDMLRDMIFDAWSYYDSVLEQTLQKAALCEERVRQIHNQSSERNGFVTDILLLVIGTVSFFGLALDIARSSREFSTDATVGLRDEGYIDILSRISGVPMDAVIGLAFAGILGMAVLYGLFRWRRLL